MPINTVTLSGFLGTDPQPINQKGARARLGVLQGRDKSGKDKPTLWIDLSAWNDWTSSALLTCAKRDRVTVTGRLSVREYTDNEGIKRQSFGVVLSQLEKHDRGKPAPAPSPQTNTQPTHPIEDEIPF
jgi:single-stranded DNA-binding protein